MVALVSCGTADNRTATYKNADDQTTLPVAMARPHYLVSAIGVLFFQNLLRPANDPLGFSYCFVIVLAMILYFVLRLENKRRESLRVDEDERDRLAFMDLTDQENPYFRYVL